MSVSASVMDLKLTKYPEISAKDSDRPLLMSWIELKDIVDAFKEMPNGHHKRQAAKDFAAEYFKRLDTIDTLKSKYPIIQEEFKAYKLEFISISQYLNSSQKVLEQCAVDYFSACFKNKGIAIKDKDIEFSNKKSGVQVGRVASIKYIDKISKTEQSVFYHIKTHQHGSASGSPSVKPVDPKELFVYRVLELIGVGPEVHFIFNSLSQGGCYIATRDLGSSKPEKTQKPKEFKTYEAIKDKLKTEGDLNPTLVAGLSCADLLSRIFCLEDVTTNSTNFGFRMNKEGANQWGMKCKIVDFRINTHDSYEYRDIFKGFLDGNGMFNYTDEFLKHVLKDRPEVERIKTADVVLKQLLVGGKKLPLMKAIEKAFGEIQEYIHHKQGSSSIDIPKDAEADFNKYISSIHKNFEQLSTGIFGKIKEFSAVYEQSASHSVPVASLQFQYQSAQPSSSASTNKPSPGTEDLGNKGPKF